MTSRKIARKKPKKHKKVNSFVEEPTSKDVDIRESLSFLCNGFMENRENANNLVDVIAMLQESTDENVIIITEALNNMLNCTIERDVKNAEPTEVVDTYCKWLVDRVREIEDSLRRYLSHEDSKLREKSLHSLLSLLVYYPLLTDSDTFPDSSLLVSMEIIFSNSDNLVAKFVEYCKKYLDIRESSLRCLKLILEQDSAEPYAACSAVFLLAITFSDLQQQSLKLCLPEGVSPKLKYQSGSKVIGKLFNDVWEQLIRCALPPRLFKQVLTWVPEEVLPHLTNPLCVTDLFMEAFTVGGGVSVLALNGIFLLINKYHLEYPHFYTKVYSMLTPQLFAATYSGRFFRLLDIFLTSTHISESLVAAFIKKLCRLAILAPPNICHFLIVFVQNLLLRHSTLDYLVHKPAADSVSCDPYDEIEEDPSNSHAQESSLWELELLRHHVVPEVATAAAFISKPMPEMESQASELLDVTMDEMITSELSERIDDVPLTFESPVGVFKCDVWSSWTCS